MKPRVKALALALVAALVVAAGAASAPASSISVDDQSFRIVWPEFTFVLSGFESVMVRCPVTMEGSFHARTFAKVSGSLIGSIGTAAFGTCAGGSATVLPESLPWQVTYASFSGTLPAITGVTIHVVTGRVAITSSQLNASCLGTATALEPLVGTFQISAGRASQLALGRGRIDLNDLTGFICDLAGIDGELEGTGAVEDRSGSPLGFTLI